MQQLAVNDLKLILNKLKPILLKASNAIKDVYQTDFDVETKADNSPVTEADEQSNKIICNGINSLGLNIPIISEENKQLDYETRKTFEYCWILDPLDGTKEFVAKNGEFAINLALCHKNQVILGIVYAPVSDMLYWAIKGQGAYKESLDGEVVKLQSKPHHELETSFRIVTSRSHLSPASQELIDTFENAIILHKGSALKFLLIAEGNADIYPRHGPTMEWDTAAPHLILEEAGGSVVDLVNNKPLTYNKPSLYNPDFIALGKEIDA
jgi:3'(2'), 5'-bisphosphate nucleotidase